MSARSEIPVSRLIGQDIINLRWWWKTETKTLLWNWHTHWLPQWMSNNKVTQKWVRLARAEWWWETLCRNLAITLVLNHFMRCWSVEVPLLCFRMVWNGRFVIVVVADRWLVVSNISSALIHSRLTRSPSRNYAGTFIAFHRHRGQCFPCIEWNLIILV